MRHMFSQFILYTQFEPFYVHKFAMFINCEHENYEIIIEMRYPQFEQHLPNARLTKEEHTPLVS